jgi:hypothetical protein
VIKCCSLWSRASGATSVFRLPFWLGRRGRMDGLFWAWIGLGPRCWGEKGTRRGLFWSSLAREAREGSRWVGGTRCLLSRGGRRSCSFFIFYFLFLTLSLPYLYTRPGISQTVADLIRSVLVWFVFQSSDDTWSIFNPFHHHHQGRKKKYKMERMKGFEIHSRAASLPLLFV